MRFRELIPVKTAWLLIAGAAALVGGCGAKVEMTLTPDVPGNSASAFKVPAKVEFDGKIDYLPRTIRPVDASDPSPIVCTYSIEVVSDSKVYTWAGFVPLVLFGMRTGYDEVKIDGRLQLKIDDVVKKEYRANCRVLAWRTIYWGHKTQSELRREGLMALRENLAVQMAADRKYLAALTGQP